MGTSFGDRVDAHGTVFDFGIYEREIAKYGDVRETANGSFAVTYRLFSHRHGDSVAKMPLSLGWCHRLDGVAQPPRTYSEKRAHVLRDAHALKRMSCVSGVPTYGSLNFLDPDSEIHALVAGSGEPVPLLIRRCAKGKTMKRLGIDMIRSSTGARARASYGQHTRCWCGWS